MTITEETLRLDQPMELQPRIRNLEPDDTLRLYLDDIGQVELLTKEQEVELAQVIEAGRLAQETIDSNSEEALIAVEGLSNRLGHSGLLELANKGQLAKEQFIAANLRLVVHWAKRYQNRGLGLGDLIQEGNFGLMRAVDKFDWRKGYKFSTYAGWWIRQAIQRGVANYGQSIRVPIHAQDSLMRMTKIISRELLQPNGQVPTLGAMAEEMQITIDKAEELYDHLQLQPHSLDVPIRDGINLTLGDIVSDDQDSVEETAEHQDLPEQVKKALSNLDDNERTVVRLRFGLDDSKPQTLNEIGKLLGRSHEFVRKTENRAMAKLRHPSTAASGLRDFLSQ